MPGAFAVVGPMPTAAGQHLHGQTRQFITDHPLPWGTPLSLGDPFAASPAAWPPSRRGATWRP